MKYAHSWQHYPNIRREFRTYEKTVVQEKQWHSKFVDEAQSDYPVEISIDKAERNVEEMFWVYRWTTKVQLLLQTSMSISVSWRLKTCTLFQLLLLFVTTSFCVTKFWTPLLLNRCCLINSKLICYSWIILPPVSIFGNSLLSISDPSYWFVIFLLTFPRYFPLRLKHKENKLWFTFINNWMIIYIIILVFHTSGESRSWSSVEKNSEKV